MHLNGDCASKKEKCLEGCASLIDSSVKKELEDLCEKTAMGMALWNVFDDASVASSCRVFCDGWNAMVRRNAVAMFLNPTDAIVEAVAFGGAVACPMVCPDILYWARTSGVWEAKNVICPMFEGFAAKGICKDQAA